MGRGSQSHAANPSHESGEPGRQQAPAAQPDAPAPEIATTTAGDTTERANGKTASERSGSDERRRGWFWHWNGIVTQYAPLIGLKGVGLLNSYTVWTDRREDSPHRGYAFPSQQSEANFYGEDRAELITINKILVALDLIEIRKEMVRKVDEQGRRWKVPQNFYRVKDRPNGLELTTADVIRVVELADKDKAVYRYIRKVFSAKFEPIDHDNVWHRILIEVAEHPTWQKLAAQAARQEARASARTKAGHRSRARQQSEPDEAPETMPTSKASAPRTQTVAKLTTGHDNGIASDDNEQQGADAAKASTSVEGVNNGSGTADEPGNTGFEPADDTASNGLSGLERGYVGVANNGHEGSVEPGNTMYYESSTTTTTTTSDSRGGDGEASSSPLAFRRAELDHPGGAGIEAGGERGATPARQALQEGIGDPAGADLQPGAAGQGGEPPQRSLADGGAGPVGDPSALVVSLYEAANDRRATPLERILLSELERDAAAPARAAGLGGADWVAAALREAVGSGSAFVAPKRIREIINRWAATGSGPRGAELGSEPRSANGHATHHASDEIAILKQVLDEMLGGEAGATLEGDLLIVRPGTDIPSLDAQQVAEIERQVAARLGRVVRLRIEAAVGSGEQGTGRPPAPVSVARRDVQQGEQLWNALLDMLAAEGAGADLLRLRAVVPIGERPDGAFLLGAPTRLAARLLEGRYRRPVERALAALLSSPVQIAVLNPDQWVVAD